MNRTFKNRKTGRYENLTTGCGYDPSKLIRKLQNVQNNYRVNILHKCDKSTGVLSQNS